MFSQKRGNAGEFGKPNGLGGALHFYCREKQHIFVALREDFVKTHALGVRDQGLGIEESLGVGGRLRWETHVHYIFGKMGSFFYLGGLRKEVYLVYFAKSIPP
jgi:hypothetical protein